ncbi:MAG: hypothetical protein SO013_10205 [Prevotella sp.]|nr:hypothetical protein [Prevotella sp.]
MKAVITGDIINSTSIALNQRAALLQCLETILNELRCLSPLEYEIFRGDSFQIVVEKAESALQIAILIRAGLRHNISQYSHTIWDARLAVGVGDIDFVTNHIVTSDGEAFQYSGRAFDELGKNNLIIKTRWENINEELKVSTLFADEIISNWTPAQAYVVYQSLALKKTQKEIASQQQQSAQNISKLSILAKEKLIRTYINRYQNLIILNQ